MISGVSLSVTCANIALFVRKNENGLANSLLRLSSGKKINYPSDGIPDFFYSEKLNRESSSLEPVLREIAEGLAFIDVASAAGESVFNAVRDMKELTRQYYLDTTSDDDKIALEAEFDTLKRTISGIIAKTTYNGLNIISDNGGNPFKRIALATTSDPITIDLSYTADTITDVSSLTLGVGGKSAETDAVEAQLVRAGSYLAKTSAYFHGLNSHYTLVRNSIDVQSAAADRIVDSDTGEEYVQSMNKSIRNQAAYSMLAQANLYRSSIVKLFG